VRGLQHNIIRCCYGECARDAVAARYAAMLRQRAHTLPQRSGDTRVFDVTDFVYAIDDAASLRHAATFADYATFSARRCRY